MRSIENAKVPIILLLIFNDLQKMKIIPHILKSARYILLDKSEINTEIGNWRPIFIVSSSEEFRNELSMKYIQF